MNVIEPFPLFQKYVAFIPLEAVGHGNVKTVADYRVS
jgi:hypothetical protein